MGKTTQQEIPRYVQESCEGVIDKYVEFDAVILLLDVLLLRVQSYRHLLFNYHLTSSVLWKLSVVLVLCEAYTKLRRLGLEGEDAVVFQINFHSFFVLSIIETLIFYLACYAVMSTFTSPSYTQVFRVVVISSYGKLSGIGAMIWTGDFYLWLPLVLVLPSQFQTFRGCVSFSRMYNPLSSLQKGKRKRKTAKLLHIDHKNFVHNYKHG